MRYILLIIFTLILPIRAYSLSCSTPNLFNNENIFLFAIEKVENIKIESNAANKIAHGNVLVVYKGDVEKISKLSSIEINVSCNNTWGPECDKIEDKNFPFSAGKRYFVFNSNDNLTMYMHKCGGNTFENTIFQQQKIEKEYPPLWVRNK